MNYPTQKSVAIAYENYNSDNSFLLLFLVHNIDVLDWSLLLHLQFALFLEALTRMLF